MPETTPRITEIIDNGPQARAYAALFFALSVVFACAITALILAYWLQLDERAAAALAEARLVGDATRYYKIVFWIVFWLSASAVVAAAAVAVTARLTIWIVDKWQDTQPGYLTARARELPRDEPELIQEGSLPVSEYLRRQKVRQR